MPDSKRPTASELREVWLPAMNESCDPNHKHHLCNPSVFPYCALRAALDLLADAESKNATLSYNLDSANDALAMARDAMGAADYPFLDDGIRALKARLVGAERDTERLAWWGRPRKLPEIRESIDAAREGGEGGK